MKKKTNKKPAGWFDQDQKWSMQKLIDHVGAGNIMVQYLASSLVSAKAMRSSPDDEVRVTFATNMTTVDELMGRRPRNVGVIMWFPVDKLPAVLLKDAPAPE